jgi:hypothetical protein
MSRRVTLADVPDRRDVVRGIRDRVPAWVVRCPDCGWPLGVDEAVEKFTPADPTAPRVIVRVAVCGGCEFTHEF